MALSVVMASRGPTRQDWERVRPILQALYVEANMPLKTVMNMLRERGFRATPKMFKDKIKIWGMSKNYSEADFQAIVQLLQITPVTGWHSLLYKGQPINFDAIKRRLQVIRRKPEYHPSFDELFAFVRDVQRAVATSGPMVRRRSSSASSFESLDQVSFLRRPSDCESILARLGEYFEWWFKSPVGEQYFSKPGAQRPARAGPGTYGRPFSTAMHPAEFNQAYVRGVRLYNDGHRVAAVILVGEACEKLRLLVREQHPALVSSLLFNFAGHWACRWLDARRSVLRFAAEMAAICHGEDHLLTQLCRFLLENFEDGYGFMLWKRYSMVFLARLGSTHRLTKYVNLMLMQSMIENGRYGDAERHVREEMDAAFEIDLLNPTPACVCFMRRKARLYRLQGRGPEAWRCLRKTFEILLGMLRDDQSPARHNLVVEETFRTIQELVMFYESEGNEVAAITTRHGALNVCLAVRGVHDSKTSTVISALHKCLLQYEGRRHEAHDLTRRYPCVFLGKPCKDARILSVQEDLGEKVHLHDDGAVEVHEWLLGFLRMQPFMYYE